jgi:molybdenum-dependent DNA-binding transcriptional regulator ModE
MVSFNRFVLSSVAAIVIPAVVVVADPGAVTAEQYGTIMNLAGRQRMLTQKMVKETLLVAADIDADANRKALGETIALFETTLKGLRDGDASTGLPKTTNERIVKQLDSVKVLFEETKPVLTRAAGGEKPSSADLTLLADKNVPLLDEMNKAVQLYERSAKEVLKSDEALAVVINLAGKQRMLSQKMSKEFLFVYLGVKADENRLNVRETASLFDQTLNGLRSGNADLGLPGTKDPAAQKLLEAGAALWKDFQPAVAKAADSEAKLAKADAELVARANMPLLKAMNEAVQYFEKHASESKVASGG